MNSVIAPEVTINQGRLIGSIGKNDENEIYYMYQGIPYAKPPIEALRFKAPQPPEKWSGTFNATKEGNACYSRHMLYPQKIIGSEDCLILNVYTKSLENPLKPVLFWIHGGGFVCGSSSRDLYGPDFLLREDVVLVTINYRTGILGLLSLKDPSLEVHGNAAFKDIVMALRWVKENIREFGGDPDNVTIFGESAGGAAVHLMVLSPMAKGLFHKAIAQSGTALNEWCESSQDITPLANLLDIDPTDEKNLYKRLMEKSVDEILQIQESIPDFKNFFPSLQRSIGVVIEQNAKQPFLNESLFDIIVKEKFNKVPLIIGYNSLEGTIFNLFKSPNEFSRPTIEDHVLWKFGYKLGSPESKKIAERIQTFYGSCKQSMPNNEAAKYKMIGDPMFLYGIFLSALNQASRSSLPVYMYRMSIETDLNLFKKLMNVSIPGASHLDDVSYLFKTDLTPKIKHGSKEDVAQRTFVKLWTNFAKFGNPTPDKDNLLNNIKWEPLNIKKLNVIDIGGDYQMIKCPESYAIEFWANLELNSYSNRKS